ncbi:hypothetical protein ACI77O_13655 [Pseudomonas tritici]|uniref:hypothetical protein n=1 Tax=Pseudomonas tritici TaxID=2745518 RepID=UPI00387AA64E
MTVYSTPEWMAKYADGHRMSQAQASAAYSSYYNLDGSADGGMGIEELMPAPERLLRPYASRTGTKTTLANMRRLGWSILVSAAGVLRTESFENWALDNGAWTAFQQGKPFDEDAFSRAIDKVGEGAQWIVLPDIVAGGMASLDLTLKWKDRLGEGFPSVTLIAVQDGMCPDDVREYLGPMCGLFIGGSTEWKLTTMDAWGQLARRTNCYMHVGRVNTLRRINACAQAGADSFDGTSVMAFPDSIFTLNRGVLTGQHQQSLFNPRTQHLDAVEYDCGWCC